MPFFFKKIPLSVTALMALTLLTSIAQAQNSVIPYQGTLFSQGKPVSQNAPVRMAFAIYSSPVQTSDPSSAPGNFRKWSSWGASGADTVDDSDAIDVKVRNGRFLVHLGEETDGQEPLAESVFDTAPLYVVAWVINSTGVFKLPYQKLEMVPHAVTASRANGFEVSGELLVKDYLITQGNNVPSGIGQITVVNRGREGYEQDGNTHFNYQSGSGYDNYITATNNRFRASHNHIFSSGTVLFRDSLAIRQVSGEEEERTIDGSSTKDIYAQCDPQTEIILSGGCAKSSIYLEIYYDYTQFHDHRHICRVRNTDSIPRVHDAYAICLKVR